MSQERPILFSAPMVRAILDGRKTQTRRPVVLPRAMASIGGNLDKAHPDLLWGVTPGLKVPCADDTTQRLRNPWLWPSEDGVRLWVRETWAPHFIWEGAPPRDIPNDGQSCFFYRADGAISGGCSESQRAKTWRPSIHMPRWASRITLEVTDVRVERLQAVTEEDARAEGVEDYGIGNLRVALAMGFDRYHFATLWDSAYGDGAWLRNPWVWVVSFKRAT